MGGLREMALELEQREVPLQWAHVVMVALAVPPRWRAAPRPTARADVAPDEPERPEFVQWLLYGEATLQAPLSAMARVGRIRNKTPEMQAGIDAVLSDARHSLSMRAKLLEQRLEGRDFLVAGRMTLADISVGYPLNTMGKPDFASLLGPRATAFVSACLRGQRSSAPRPFPSLGWAVNS